MAAINPINKSDFGSITKITIHLILIIAFLLSTVAPIGSVNAKAQEDNFQSKNADINLTGVKISVFDIFNSFLNDLSKKKNKLQNNSESSPVFYLGYEHLPEVNLQKPSCSDDSCSRWEYGNTNATTLDNVAGIVFKVDFQGETGKRMQCSHAGCDGAKSMFSDTSDNFAVYPNNTTYCVANNAFGFDKNVICDQVVPSAVKLLSGASGFPSTALTYMAGGFAIGWHKSYNVTIRVYDIHFIYYGTLEAYLLNRSTLSTNSPKNGPGDARECAINGCANSASSAGDPIDTRTGNFDYSLVDLTLQTIAGPLTFQRSYASQAVDTNQYPTNLAPGWTHNHDTRLIFETDYVWFKAHTNNQYRFTNNGNQTFTPYPGVLATLVFNSGDNTYTLKSSDLSVYTFNSQGRLVSWRNELDYGFDYYYNDGLLYRVIEPLSGLYLQFTYLGNQLTTVNDNTGRQVSFGYDGNGDLTSFTDVRSFIWTYDYVETSHRLAIIREPSTANKTILTVHYDSQGRAFEQFNGKGERIVKITYDNGDETSIIEDALGRKSTDGYDGSLTNSFQIDAAGYRVDKYYDDNFRLTQIKDQNNRITTFHWSPDGANLTYVKDAAGYETSLEYNAQNHLTKVIDPRTQETTFLYDGALLTNSTRHTTTKDIITTYTYTTAADAPQPSGLLKTVTDPLNHTTSFDYDSKGQLESITNADGKVTTFLFYDTGLTHEVTDPLGRVTHYEYDPAGNVRFVVRNFDQSKSKNEENQYNLTDELIYDEQGRMVASKNTLDYVTTYVYDDASRLWQVIDPHLQTTTYLYNAAGQLTEISDQLGRKTSYVYDTATDEDPETNTGRLKNIQNSLNQVIQSLTYYPDGTINTETQPSAAGDYVVTYATYDLLKRPTQITDNNGHSSIITYDAYGNPLTRTDALGRITKYEYNELELLWAVIENFKDQPGLDDDPNATNVRTQYTYDDLGHLKTITDANNHVTTFGYDPLNRLETITDHLNQITTYQYDTLQNKKTVIDNNSFSTVYTFDLADRLETIDYPVGTADVNFDYDPLGRLTDMYDGLGHTQWVYDNLNRVESITDPFNKFIDYGYDDENNRSSITYPAPINKTITYQYNTLDQLADVSDGSVQLAHYTYDTANRLLNVSRGNGVNSTYSYTLSGKLEDLTHQNSNSQQLAKYHYQYDSVGNIDWVEEQVIYPHFTYLPTIFNEGEGGLQGLGELPEGGDLPADPIPADGYPAPSGESQLNQGGENLVSGGLKNSYPAPEITPESIDTSLLHQVWNFFVKLFDDEIPTVSAENTLLSDYPPPVPPESGNPPPTSHTIDYSYDALNRLIGAAYSESDSYIYDYDKVGNRTSQIINNVETIYTYDELNRLTNANGVAFTWDANGNLLNDGSNAYTYDHANRLIGVNGQGSTYSFAYDGLGNRYQQTANGNPTTYLLDISGDLSQVLSDGTANYYYSLERIAQEVNAGSYEYFLPDSLGSVRQIAGDSQFPSYAQSFDPFGNLINWEGKGSSSFGYAGEITDSSGLVFLRARYYSPSLGIFTSRDPVMGVLGQPATLNPYIYALNNPVLHTDPSGEFVLPFLAAAGIGGLISAAIDVVGQVLNMRPTSVEQALRCLDWRQVGISFAAGAVAGFAGFTVFGGITALFGTGFLANIAGGAVSGIIAGQYGRITGLVLSGQIDQIRGSMFRWQDVVLDAVFGGAISGITYGLSNVLARIRTKVSTNLSISPTNSTRIPNPNGRLGGPAHQSKVKQLIDELLHSNINYQTEYQIYTPGGSKPYRFVDVAALDTNGNPTALYQIGKVTKNNIPIARERAAIIDIYEFGEYEVPIIYLPID